MGSLEMDRKGRLDLETKSFLTGVGRKERKGSSRKNRWTEEQLSRRGGPS